MKTKEYQGAMNFYGYALMLDGDHPEPMYQMAVCLQAMGWLADARMALQSAISMSEARPCYSAIRATPIACLISCWCEPQRAACSGRWRQARRS